MRLFGLRTLPGAGTAFILRRRGPGLLRGMGDRAILDLSSMLWILGCHRFLLYPDNPSKSRRNAEAAKFHRENSPQAAARHWAGARVRRFHRSGLLFHGFVRNADAGRRVAGRDSATSRG